MSLSRDLPARVALVEGDHGLDVEPRGRRSVLGEARRERHREAGGVRRRDQLLRARPPVVLLGPGRPGDGHAAEGTGRDVVDGAASVDQVAVPGRLREPGDRHRNLLGQCGPDSDGRGARAWPGPQGCHGRREAARDGARPRVRPGSARASVATGAGSRRRRIRRLPAQPALTPSTSEYTTGMTSRVRKVELNRPPMTTVPSSAAMIDALVEARGERDQGQDRGDRRHQDRPDTGPAALDERLVVAMPCARSRSTRSSRTIALVTTMPISIRKPIRALTPSGLAREVERREGADRREREA